MTKKRLIINPGLHKTGHTFLNIQLFPKLDKNKICHNPKKITDILQVSSKKKLDESDIKKLSLELNSELEKIEQETILFSFEALYGEVLNSYENFEKINELLSNISQNVEIVLVIRNQPDWILSLYKQYVALNNYVTINEFLNFKNGEFTVKSDKNPYSIHPFDYKFGSMYNTLIQMFGEKKIHILFYEELANHPDDFIQRWLRILNCQIDFTVNFQPVNRSYSALAIYLTLIKGKLFRSVPMNNLSQNTDSAFISKIKSLAKNEKYELESQSTNNESKLKIYFGKTIYKIAFQFRFLRKLTWRRFIQRYFDRLIYVNWDLMGKKRKILSEYFYHDNLALKPMFPNNEIASFYLMQNNRKIN